MKLNLPEYDFKISRKENGKKQIFDEFRKKHIILTTRRVGEGKTSLNIWLMIYNTPSSLISIEKGLKVNNLQKRFDAVVFNRNGNPLMLLEFKAPAVKITQKVMEQISRYNLSLNVNYLLVSNGIMHFCCFIDKNNDRIQFLDKIPVFNKL